VHRRLHCNSWQGTARRPTRTGRRLLRLRCKRCRRLRAKPHPRSHRRTSRDADVAAATTPTEHQQSTLPDRRLHLLWAWQGLPQEPTAAHELAGTHRHRMCVRMRQAPPRSSGRQGARLQRRKAPMAMEDDPRRSLPNAALPTDRATRDYCLRASWEARCGGTVLPRLLEGRTPASGPRESGDHAPTARADRQCGSHTTTAAAPRQPDRMGGRRQIRYRW
jgi:hypothetical protein